MSQVAMDGDLTIYRRKLPHWKIGGGFYFITFRTVNDLRLDHPSKTIVLEAIKFLDNKKHRLYACVVMDQHVHLILNPLEKGLRAHHSLAEIMQSIKGYSAWKVNAQQNRKGQVWVAESYDRVIRDEPEFLEKLNYILNNPVKAGLAEEPQEYQWLYLKEQE